MHPRACVSAISTFRLSLADDLSFWPAHGINTVGVSVAKLEAYGWDAGTELVVDAVGRGLQVVDLIGLGCTTRQPGRHTSTGCWARPRRLGP